MDAENLFKNNALGYLLNCGVSARRRTLYALVEFDSLLNQHAHLLPVDLASLAARLEEMLRAGSNPHEAAERTDKTKLTCAATSFEKCSQVRNNSKLGRNTSVMAICVRRSPLTEAGPAELLVMPESREVNKEALPG